MNILAGTSGYGYKEWKGASYEDEGVDPTPATEFLNEALDN